MMSKAGFPKSDCAKLAALVLNPDFYVDYDIRDRAYSKDWRVYYPAQLG